MDIVGYKYNTLEEAEIALGQASAYFNLPCGETLRWTDIQEGNGFWYLVGEGVEEILGEPVIIEI